jgi:uncharacterized protein
VGLENLKAQGRSVIDIVGDDDIVSRSERTRAALREGADVIYQGAFLEGPWQGYSDFLLKVPRPSALGDYSYEVADTKLSRSATVIRQWSRCCGATFRRSLAARRARRSWRMV